MKITKEIAATAKKVYKNKEENVYFLEFEDSCAFVEVDELGQIKDNELNNVFCSTGNPLGQQFYYANSNIYKLSNLIFNDTPVNTIPYYSISQQTTIPPINGWVSDREGGTTITIAEVGVNDIAYYIKDSNFEEVNGNYYLDGTYNNKSKYSNGYCELLFFENKWVIVPANFSTKYPEDEIYLPLTLTAEEANSTVKLTEYGKPIVDGLQYRTNNNSSWAKYTINTVINLTNVGDYVQFQNTNNELSISVSDYVQFKTTGKIAASGNIQSMLNYSISCTPYCYYHMFYNCTELTEAPELPATTLAYYCYYGMFDGCTNLTEAPELPATNLANDCYANMFRGCTSLTKAPELPATTLDNWCYTSMFNGCTSLTKAPELPATNLAYYCYRDMFRGCTSLTKAPELPATTLANWCYDSMFDGCTSLVEAPKLPATKLIDYCYTSMFYGCTSLVEAPKLPATKLIDYCYASMFGNCTSLTKAPELPATTLAEGCYKAMFRGCTSLTTAPELPATTLAEGCYSYMFWGCTSLLEIKVLFTYWNSSATDSWLSGVSSTGTFYKPSALHTKYGTDRIPSGWTVVNIEEIDEPIEITPPEELEKTPLTFTALADNVTINIDGNNNTPISSDISLYYRLNDSKKWIKCDKENINIVLQEGESVQFYNMTETWSTDINNYHKFDISGFTKVSGNIHSLINFVEELPTASVFANVFYNCVGLTDASQLELPAVTLTENCYARMFFGCSNLTNAPVLPALNLARDCYYGMFDGCTSLTVAPELPATTLAVECYEYMFHCCSNLTSAPELPATTLAAGCYLGMFWGCTSLEIAPVLPATELVQHCYSYMFNYCSNLSKLIVNFSDWSVETATFNWLMNINNTNGTFIKPKQLSEIHGISYIPLSWTIEIIENPLTFTAEEANSTIKLIRYGSPVLNDSPVVNGLQYRLSTYGKWIKYAIDTEITLANIGDIVQFQNTNYELSKDNDEYVQFEMTGKIAASGNMQSMLNYSDSCTEYCYYSMFNGCTSLTKAPELPATELANWCYYGMFYGCTSLTEAPKLPVTDLAFHCYSNMFNGCTSLTKAPDLPATKLSGTCYYNMFSGCTSLTKAPELPATTLDNWCYASMFDGCTSLTEAPKLPATTLANYCYSDMFNGCTSLTEAPELPATALTDFCYEYMFVGCTSLIEAPELPATTLTQYCYRGMFEGCTSLEQAPELPATNLAESCYFYMFAGCTSLTSAPELPATTLARDCYNSMFAGCTSLTKAPELPATTLARDCYSFMFEGCTSLNYIKVGFTNWNDATNATTTTIWLYNVSPTGTFVCPSTLPQTRGESYIPEGWTVINDSDETPLTFTAEEANSTIKLDSFGSPTVDGLQYRTNNSSDWTKYTINTAITLSNVGDYVQFKNTKDTLNTETDDVYFVMTGKIAGSGNIQSMLNYSDSCSYYCYRGMFSGCSSLTIAPELPATILASGCYRGMFSGCSSLTIAPELPATTLANHCYTYMFYDCSSLTIAPELPATTLAYNCYNNMFYNCRSLTEAPELPATILAVGCYNNMFSGCESLTEAPELPATTLAELCYFNMFRACRSLTKAPKLPATTLAYGCYNQMFEYCTSLVEAPELPATTLAEDCYNWMFANCTNISEIKVLFTDWNDNATSNWLNNVSSTGTFYKPSALPEEYGDSRIPEGWTVIDIDKDETKPLTLTAEEANSTIVLIEEGSPTVDGLQYRLNKNDEWITYKIGTEITLTNFGDYVQFQNTKETLSFDTYNYAQFVMTGKIAASGNIQSMLNYSNSCTPYCFCTLFKDCTSLTVAPELPATNLANFCYREMFNSCTSLTTAPELPATTLAKRCYASMFYNCIRLTTAPELPATTLAEGCYIAMFGECRRLIGMPELPATELVYDCYKNMFYGCTSLTEIKVLFIDWNMTEDTTFNWLYNVSSTGTFYKPSALPEEFGDSNIPLGWTVVNIDE